MSEPPLKPDFNWPDYGSAVERDREREPGMADEWTDDDPPEVTEFEKLRREIHALKSAILRGDEIDHEDDED
ncbi:MAG TPA: hypothetical protein VIG36_02465 [Methylocystis sp.]